MEHPVSHSETQGLKQMSLDWRSQSVSDDDRRRSPAGMIHCGRKRSLATGRKRIGNTVWNRSVRVSNELRCKLILRLLRYEVFRPRRSFWK